MNASSYAALTRRMVRLRLSKLGLTLGLIFLLAAATLFAIHVNAFAANGPADIGDRALLFFVFTLPWALMLPDWVVNAEWWSDGSYYVSWLFVGANAFLLYCVSGGIGLREVKARDRVSRRDMRPDPHAVRDG